MEYINNTLRKYACCDIESIELVSPITYSNVKAKYKAEVARKVLLENEKKEFFDLNSLVIDLNNCSELDYKTTDDLFSSDILTALINEKLVLKKDILNRELKNYIKELEGNNKYLMDYDYSKFHIKLKVCLNTHSKKDIVDKIVALRNCEDILCVCPNYYYDYATNRSGGEISDLWYLNAINYFSIQNTISLLPKETVTVGVMDSGIDKYHNDLFCRIDETLSESFSPDHAPYVDNRIHGTCVAGIIGALANNDSGTTGICQDVNLVSLKVGALQPELSAILSALDYIKQDDVDIDIVNMSFEMTYSKGGGATMEELMEDADCLFSGYNGLIVCAASNEGINLDSPTNHMIYAPAMLHLSNVISVAANDEMYELADFSNYGNVSVDISAPGVELYTTQPNNSYKFFSGTSAAVPVVTGISAILKSIHPEITPQQIKSFIMNNADVNLDLFGKVVSNGMVNLYNTVMDTLSKKFYINYNANGGTGSTINSTTVYYNVNKSLEANTYLRLDYRFVGWIAHRNSDNKWLYSNHNENHWYLEGNQPSGYTKFVYNDCARVAKTSSQNNDIVTMYAQWEPLSLGDINLDGNISVEDVTELQLYLAEMISLTYQQLRLADVNEDGIINISDVTELQWLIAS